METMAKQIKGLICLLIVSVLFLVAVLGVVYKKTRQPEMIENREIISWCQNQELSEDEKKFVRQLLMEDAQGYHEDVAVKETKRFFVIDFYEIYYKNLGVWYSCQTWRLR